MPGERVAHLVQGLPGDGFSDRTPPGDAFRSPAATTDDRDLANPWEMNV